MTETKEFPDVGIADAAEVPEILRTQHAVHGDSVNMVSTYCGQARTVLGDEEEEPKWQLVTSEYQTEKLVCENLVSLGYLKRKGRGAKQTYAVVESHHQVRVLRVTRDIRAREALCFNGNG